MIFSNTSHSSLQDIRPITSRPIWSRCEAFIVDLRETLFDIRTCSRNTARCAILHSLPHDQHRHLAAATATAAATTPPSNQTRTHPLQRPLSPFLHVFRFLDPACIQLQTTDQTSEPHTLPSHLLAQRAEPLNAHPPYCRSSLLLLTTYLPAPPPYVSRIHAIRRPDPSFLIMIRIMFVSQHAMYICHRQRLVLSDGSYPRVIVA